MKLIISLPLALNEIGRRKNNEDNIYPEKGKASAKDNLFLVCDGIGGAEKGEVASKLACEGFAGYFEKHPVEFTDGAYINRTLNFVQSNIDHYLNEHPEHTGMGTTMTLLNLHKKGATIAWCGDSRVYHIRNGEILFKTEDHSLVNELIKAGALTPEEAETSEQKNIITRAIQGNQIKKVKADVVTISDIKAGDSFFLCTDGILESISDEMLVNIFKTHPSDTERISVIEQRCREFSSDNYSAYLITVQSVEGVATSQNKSEEPIYMKEERPDGIEAKTRAESKLKTKKQSARSDEKRLKLVLSLFILLIISALVVLFFYQRPLPNEKKQVKKTGTEVQKEKVTVIPSNENTDELKSKNEKEKRTVKINDAIRESDTTRQTDTANNHQVIEKSCSSTTNTTTTPKPT